MLVLALQTDFYGMKPEESSLTHFPVKTALLFGSASIHSADISIL